MVAGAGRTAGTLSLTHSPGGKKKAIIEAGKKLHNKAGFETCFSSKVLGPKHISKPDVAWKPRWFIICDSLAVRARGAGHAFHQRALVGLCEPQG